MLSLLIVIVIVIVVVAAALPQVVHQPLVGELEPPHAAPVALLATAAAVDRRAETPARRALRGNAGVAPVVAHEALREQQAVKPVDGAVALAPLGLGQDGHGRAARAVVGPAQPVALGRVQVHTAPALAAGHKLEQAVLERAQRAIEVAPAHLGQALAHHAVEVAVQQHVVFQDERTLEVALHDAPVGRQVLGSARGGGLHAGHVAGKVAAHNVGREVALVVLEHILEVQSVGLHHRLHVPPPVVVALPHVQHKDREPLAALQPGRGTRRSGGEILFYIVKHASSVCVRPAPPLVAAARAARQQGQHSIV